MMELALREAGAAAARGEVPIGAVVIGPDGAALAWAGNRCEELRDPTAHAEMLAMREAARLLGSARLPECDLVVTLEPCPMCAAAIGFFRIRRVVFGAYDPKGGGIDHGPRIFEAPGAGHRPEVVGGVRESESAELLKAFFQPRRTSPSPLVGEGRGEG